MTPAWWDAASCITRPGWSRASSANTVEGYRGPFAVSILSQHFYETDPPAVSSVLPDAARAQRRAGGHGMRRLSAAPALGRRPSQGFPRDFCPYGKPDGDDGRPAAAGKPRCAVRSSGDRWGIPAPKMIYSLDQNTRDMIEHGIASATRASRRPCLGNRAAAAAGPSGFHLLGTACMGADPGASVVNAVSRAHSVPIWSSWTARSSPRPQP